MKICFLTDDPPEIGGGPEHIRMVAHYLKSRYGCVVDVVTPKNMDSRFDVTKLVKRVRYVFWALRFMFTTDYDFYFSHAFSTDFFLPLVKLRGKKTAVTIHGLGVNMIGGGILNTIGLPKLFNWLILHVWPFDFRMSAGDIDGFVTVGNGVDVTEFDREKSKPDPKHFTVVCVSRPDPVKGVDILKEAITIVQKNHANVRLCLVSGRRRTAKDFKAANLYVLPSLSEGLPIVLLEAMAAKLPIVTTDVGDCKRLVESAKAGLVVKPGDPTALAKAVSTMINENLKQFGENGYRFVKKNYSWEEVGRKVAQTIGLTMIKSGTK